MNSLYTQGVRQTNSIQADLERLRTGDASASLLGLSVILIPHLPLRHSKFLDESEVMGHPVWAFERWHRLDVDGLLTAYRSAFLFVFG